MPVVEGVFQTTTTSATTYYAFCHDAAPFLSLVVSSDSSASTNFFQSDALRGLWCHFVRSCMSLEVATRSDILHNGMMLSLRWTLKVAICFVGSSCILMDMVGPSVWMHPSHFTASNGVERRALSRVNVVRCHDDASSLPLSCRTRKMLIGRWSRARVPTHFFPGTAVDVAHLHYAYQIRLQSCLEREGRHSVHKSNCGARNTALHYRLHIAKGSPLPSECSHVPRPNSSVRQQIVERNI